jgi:OHCU decarboxylase
VTIEDLNARSREGFVEAIGWAFESSPWVAERAWRRRPFSSLDTLHEAMVAEVASATLEERLALLRAHPDLGAGRLEADHMSAASTREQQSAGLANLTRPEIDRLAALNATYRDKFGFPFLFAVRGATTDVILHAIEERLIGTREAELDEALLQVSRIARFRLEDVLS